MGRRKEIRKTNALNRQHNRKPGGSEWSFTGWKYSHLVTLFAIKTRRAIWSCLALQESINWVRSSTLLYNDIKVLLIKRLVVHQQNASHDEKNLAEHGLQRIPTSFRLQTDHWRYTPTSHRPVTVHTDFSSTTHRLLIDHWRYTPTSHWPHADFSSTTYRPNIDFCITTNWPHTDRILPTVLYRPLTTNFSPIAYWTPS